MKPKDPVWNMFTICEMNGKDVAICKDCNSSVSAKSDRVSAQKSGRKTFNKIKAKSDRLHNHSKKCVPTKTPQKIGHMK